MDDLQLVAVVEAHRVEGRNMKKKKKKKKNREVRALSRSFPFLSFSRQSHLVD